MSSTIGRKNEAQLDIVAQMCHNAQAHIGATEAWPMDRESRENRLQCVSYAVACFLAQNTVYGDDGVEWSVIIDELVAVPQTIKDGFVCKSHKEWVKILSKLVKKYGGWK